MGELGELRSRVDGAVERLAAANATRKRQSQGLMTLLTDLEAKYEARSEELEFCQKRIEALTRENADLSGLVEQLVQIVDTTVTTGDDDALFRAAAMAEDLVADWQGANEDAPDEHAGTGAETSDAEPVAQAETAADPVEAENPAPIDAAASIIDSDYLVTDEIVEQPEHDSAAQAFAALEPEMRFEDVSDDELSSERLDGDPAALAALLDTPLTPDADVEMADEIDAPVRSEAFDAGDAAAVVLAADLDGGEIDLEANDDASGEEAYDLDPIREMMAADLDIPEIVIDDDEPVSRIDADDDTESSIRAMMARLEEAAARAKLQSADAPEAEAEADKAPATAVGGAR